MEEDITEFPHESCLPPVVLGRIPVVKLQIACTNQYNDVQYYEHPEGSFLCSELNPDHVWVIRTPSQQCVTNMRHFVPFSVLKTFNKIEYLLSPKADTYFVTKNVYAESLVISFPVVYWEDEKPVSTCYMLFTKKHGRPTFSHFLATRNRDQDSSKAALIAQANQVLQFTFKPHWLQLQGTLTLLRNYNRVIDFKTYIYTNIYHVNLSLRNAACITNSLRARFLDGIRIREPVKAVVELPDCPLSEVLLVRYQDLRLPNCPQLHPVALEVLLRLYNKESGFKLPFVKQLYIVPFHVYKGRDQYEEVQEF